MLQYKPIVITKINSFLLSHISNPTNNRWNNFIGNLSELNIKK